MNNLRRPALKIDLYSLRNFLENNRFNCISVKHSYRLGVIFLIFDLYSGIVDENNLKSVIDKWYYDKNILISKIMELVK